MFFVYCKMVLQQNMKVTWEICWVSSVPFNIYNITSRQAHLATYTHLVTISQANGHNICRSIHFPYLWLYLSLWPKPEPWCIIVSSFPTFAPSYSRTGRNWGKVSGERSVRFQLQCQFFHRRFIPPYEVKLGKCECPARGWSCHCCMRL